MAKAKERCYYLMSKSEETIRGSKLPSKGQVLRVFLHQHIDNKKDLRESAEVIYKEVQNFWERARIPTKRKDHITEKILELHGEWKRLKKNATRRSNTQECKEKAFKDELGNLFDVAHAEALKLIKNEEDKQFLLAQREEGRNGSMTSADLVTAKQEKQSKERKEKLEERKRKAKEAMAVTKAKGEYESSTSENEESLVEEKASTPLPPKRSCLPRNMMSPGLSAALDRTGVSDRAATYILTEAARSFGQDTAELNISRSTIKRHREKHRKEYFQCCKGVFEAKPSVIHWDGKLIPDLLDTTESVDRLPVIATSLTTGESHILGVPKLSSGTGENQADAVCTLVKEWGLSENILGMCFDTTVHQYRSSDRSMCSA